MYYYSTVDNIITSHSSVVEKNGFDYIDLHFERPNEKGFDFLDMQLPGCAVNKTYGFSEEEILKLKRYAVNNADLLWEFARSGGGENA